MQRRCCRDVAGSPRQPRGVVEMWPDRRGNHLEPSESSVARSAMIVSLSQTEPQTSTGGQAVADQQPAASRPRTPGLVWQWEPAALGALYALPAAVVVLGDRPRGLALDRRCAPGGARWPDADPPEPASHAPTGSVNRNPDVPRWAVGGHPRARGRRDRGPRCRLCAARRALPARPNRDDPVAADGRRRAQLQRHRHSSGAGRADGAGLDSCLPRLDAVARASRGPSSRRAAARPRRRSPTASGWVPRAPRPRQSGSSSTSSTSAGLARPHCW